MAKFDPAANQFVWAQRAGGTGTDAATALAVSGASVYVAGYFDSPTASFGPIALPKPTAYSNVGYLAAIASTVTATAASQVLVPTQFFPNPARRTVTLRLPARVTPTVLTLTDGVGRTVRQYPAPVGAEAALDLDGLPAGLYVLRGAGPAQRLAVQ